MDSNSNVVYRTQVELTLSNVVVPAEKLAPGGSPSAQDGLPPEAEYDLRITGCEYIQSCGILLKLPQTAMATGQVLFHRFYYSKSFVRYNLEHLAMASINLASKIEECPRRVRDVINVFNHIKQVRAGRTIHPVILDASYVELKNQVIKAERRILKELGFCVYVKHPNKIIILYLRVLMMERNRALSQMAWNFMNDSLWTDVFLRYSPESIACACIMLAARRLNIPLPRNPPWYILFGVKLEDIEAIGLAILKLYAHKTKPYSEYEKLLAELKEKQDRERRAIREKPVEQPSAENSVVKAAPVEPVTISRSPRRSSNSNKPYSNGCEKHSKKRPLPFAPSSAVVVEDRPRRRRRRNSTRRRYSSVSSSATSSRSRSRHRHRHRRHHRHHHHSKPHRSHKHKASKYTADETSSDENSTSADSASNRKGEYDEISSGEERYLRMQLIKQAVRSMDERVGNEVLRAERIRRFGMTTVEESKDRRDRHRNSRHHRSRRSPSPDSRRRYAPQPGSTSSSTSTTTTGKPKLLSTLAVSSRTSYKSRRSSKCLHGQR